MIKIAKLIAPIFIGSISMTSVIKYIDAPKAPILKEVDVNMSNPKAPIATLNYSSRIMDKNLLNVTGFEDGDIQARYEFHSHASKPEHIHRKYGGQSRVNEFSSDGLYSTKVEDTFNNSNVSREYNSAGEFLGFENFSYATFANNYKLPENSYITVNMDVLAPKDKNKTFQITPVGMGETTVDTAPLMEKSIPGGPFIYTRDVNPGDKKVYFTNVESIHNMIEKYKSRIWIADRTTTLGEYNYCYIESVNVEEGYINLKEPMGAHIPAGENVRRHVNPGPIKFDPINIVGTDDWQTISFVSSTSTMTNYTPSKRGVKFRLKTMTDGILYLDNIQFGYANKIKLFRNNEEIYEGYDMSYKDNQAKDVSPPNKIEDIQGSIVLKDDAKNTVKVNFTASEDIGTEYIYTATASYEDKESPVSKPVKINVESGIEGYSYVIDNNPSTVPDNTVDTKDTYIDKEISKNNDTWYIHVKPIDRAGNVGETMHQKIEIHRVDLSIENLNTGVQLKWKFSDNDLCKYYFKVFRKENSGQYVELISNHGESSYTDTTATDKDNPIPITVESSSHNSDSNSFEYILSEPKDVGTKYSYYVEAYLNDNSKISTSNIANIDKKLGIKGLSYILDSDESANPNDAVNTINDNKIVVPVANEGQYLHIKAIDNAGNSSNVAHIKTYDDISPTIDLRLTDYYLTNQDVSIIVTANDDMEIKYLVLPDGTKVKSKTVNYIASNRGRYLFTVCDVAGNTTTRSIDVTNIDKVKPSASISKTPDKKWVNTGVEITINARD